MKTCDECGKQRSEEWSLSAELAKSNRRVFIILMVVILLWFATICGFIWYINQFDYVDEGVTVDSRDGGNANYIGNDGDIYNGTSNSTPQNEN